MVDVGYLTEPGYFSDLDADEDPFHLNFNISNIRVPVTIAAVSATVTEDHPPGWYPCYASGTTVTRQTKTGNYCYAMRRREWTRIEAGAPLLSGSFGCPWRTKRRIEEASLDGEGPPTKKLCQRAHLA